MSRYPLKAVTKLQAAHRQLNAAIRLHFEDGDPAAIYTLAGAASVIISDLADQHGTLSFDRMAMEANRISANRYYQIMRKAQNFLKHARDDANATIDIDLRELEDVMFMTVLNAGPLDGISTSEQVFQLWYIATRSETFPETFEPLKGADVLFPGIRDVPPEEQKRLGLIQLHKAHEYQQ